MVKPHLGFQSAKAWWNWKRDEFADGLIHYWWLRRNYYSCVGQMEIAHFIAIGNLIWKHLNWIGNVIDKKEPMKNGFYRNCSNEFEENEPTAIFGRTLMWAAVQQLHNATIFSKIGRSWSTILTKHWQHWKTLKNIENIYKTLAAGRQSWQNIVFVQYLSVQPI